MAKNQIILVGGQILPLYLGLIESKPEKAFLVYTEETRSVKDILVKNVSLVKLAAIEVKPYDFASIISTVDSIIDQDPAAEWELNLTAGTKIMALAAHTVFQAKGFRSFYINQDEKLYDIREQKEHVLLEKVSIDDFLKLSGHSSYQAQSLSDFSEEDKNFAIAIERLSNSDSEYAKLCNEYRKLKNIPSTTKLNTPKGSYVKWDRKNSIFELAIVGKTSLQSKSKNAIYIALNAGWFEIKVALIVSKWARAFETKMNVELNYKVNSEVKNEVDVLVNTGHQLLFLECKSGLVQAADVNKMKAVRNTYGGLAAKSILICRNYPPQRTIEKCADLGIQVFAFNSSSGKTQGSSQLIDTLNKALGTTQTS